MADPTSIKHLISNLKRYTVFSVFCLFAFVLFCFVLFCCFVFFLCLDLVFWETSLLCGCYIRVFSTKEFRMASFFISIFLCLLYLSVLLVCFLVCLWNEMKMKMKIGASIRQKAALRWPNDMKSKANIVQKHNKQQIQNKIYK